MAVGVNDSWERIEEVSALGNAWETFKDVAEDNLWELLHAFVVIPGYFLAFIDFVKGVFVEFTHEAEAGALVDKFLCGLEVLESLFWGFNHVFFALVVVARRF